MTAPDAIARDHLHAYVDGRLGSEAQARIEARLAQHPEDAAAVHAYRRQNRDLRETFAPVLDEPLPPSLQAAVTARTATHPRAVPSLWPGWALAASVLLLLVGGAGGWLLHGWQATPGRAGGNFAIRSRSARRRRRTWSPGCRNGSAPSCGRRVCARPASSWSAGGSWPKARSRPRN